MTAGIDLINAAATFLGEPYSTAPGRDDPGSGFKDCSGLIAASYQVATGALLGANVSVTIFDLAVRNGLEISRDAADGIAGACYLMPDDPYQGWGNAGHIGFSVGDGWTVEATPPRVQRLRNTYQPWGDRACLLPGIDYSNAGQGTSVEPAPPTPVPPPLVIPPEESMFLIRVPDSDPVPGAIWYCSGLERVHVPTVEAFNLVKRNSLVIDLGDVVAATAEPFLGMFKDVS